VSDDERQAVFAARRRRDHRRERQRDVSPPVPRPLDGHAVGFSGYFELSGPAIVPQLAFLEFPLSEPAATMTVSIGVTDGIQMIYDQANVTPDARLGFVWVSADDCHWLPAIGVTVRAMGPVKSRLP